MKGKLYSQRRLRWRRKVLDWIHGDESANAPRYWSNLDQQERHPGDRSFEYAEEVNSPLAQWKLQNGTFFTGSPAGRPPIGVRIQQALYWLVNRGPHPEVRWALKHGERGSAVVWITRIAAGAALLGILDGLGLVLGAVAGLREWAKWFVGWERYPRVLRIRLDEKDHRNAAEAVNEATQEEEGVDPELRREMMRTEMVRQAVIRRLRLNTDWLDCCWCEYLEQGIGVGIVRQAVTIEVHRTKRLLAHYELPPLALAGWTNPDILPERRIKVTNRGAKSPEAQAIDPTNWPQTGGNEEANANSGTDE